MDTILSIRQLTEALRRKVEGAFPFVWVRGEVTNLSRPASGHLYFSLKDADALLHCVWFRGQQRPTESFDPLTGEVFTDGPRRSMAERLENGQQLLCAGRVSVYAPRGSYQLLVELVQEAGLGALNAAFEQLKKRLAAKGFFALERKRPLPCNPVRVALITAATGAAVQDFIRLAAERGAGAEIRLYPVLVQGEGAAASIVRAMERVQAEAWAEVLVLIRGGGSLEDLWTFNEEAVAEAVFHASLPVLAGIGHEVDYSMCDLTADVRAATPSHAAQLLWPSRAELVQQVDSAEQNLRDAGLALLERCASRVRGQEQALGWLSPARALSRLEENFLARHERLGLAFARAVENSEARVERCRGLLQAAFGPERLQLLGDKVQGLEQNLARGAAFCVQGRAVELDRVSAALEAASPLAPLERGYALLSDAEGRVLRGMAEMRVGAGLHIRLTDGIVAATVDALYPQSSVK